MSYILNHLSVAQEKASKVFAFNQSDYEGLLLKPEVFNLLVEGLCELDPTTPPFRVDTSLDLSQVMQAVSRFNLDLSYGMCTGFEREEEQRWVEYERVEADKDRFIGEEVCEGEDKE